MGSPQIEAGSQVPKKVHSKRISTQKMWFYKMREEYVAYRKGYLEWRRGSAGGARGELTAEALEHQALADHGAAPQSEGAYGNSGNS